MSGEQLCKHSWHYSQCTSGEPVELQAREACLQTLACAAARMSGRPQSSALTELRRVAATATTGGACSAGTLCREHLILAGCARCQGVLEARSSRKRTCLTCSDRARATREAARHALATRHSTRASFREPSAAESLRKSCERRTCSIQSQVCGEKPVLEGSQ
jgi:hypothetical protein